MLGQLWNRLRSEEGGRGRRTRLEDEVLKAHRARGRQANLSYFAFTATPKTRRWRCSAPAARTGSREPFHLYSMRQAIEEGFILDVLRNYMTYATYYRLREGGRGRSPTWTSQKAKRAIARYVLHPPAQPRPKDRGHGRALPGPHPTQDRRARRRRWW